MEEDTIIDERTSVTARTICEGRQLVTEMRAKNFDVIRYATYRTACKLRFVQKRTNLHQVDIWNMIETFREYNLNCISHHTEVPLKTLETLLASLFLSLNNRLSTKLQIDADDSISLLYNWLQSAYDPEGKGRIRVFSIKVALTTICAGKMMDKLRYVFTQLSDSSGCLVRSKFEDYLREVLTLPTAVFEGPSFGYTETSAKACFYKNARVNVNTFLDTLMTEPGPRCLMWLPILHRMAAVEKVFHPIQCEACRAETFMGFRYKCQRCYNYHLCQECFWRGRTSGNHSNNHKMKEYSSYKSPAKELGRSLRKSFRCVPAKDGHKIPQFPETPEKTFDLSYIVPPPTPPMAHNGFHESGHSRVSLDASSMDSCNTSKSPSKLHSSMDSYRGDDEHRLIARYTACLASSSNGLVLKASHFGHSKARSRGCSSGEMNHSLDGSNSQMQRDLIKQLEARNREIILEIQKLRAEQERQARCSPSHAGSGVTRNPTLVAELKGLRQRRDELEARMSALQESRRELVVQLEGLMKLLKNHSSPRLTPRSTPTSSPRSRAAQSPPPSIPPPRGSAPSTPGDSLAGVGGDVREAFTQQSSPSGSSSVRNLRNDLLVAADSVTNAMSSLVKELNSEVESESEDEDERVRGNGDSMDDLLQWQEEMRKSLQQETHFMQELRARRDLPGGGKAGYSNGRTQREQYPLTDDCESYVHTDDEGAYTAEESESYLKSEEEEYTRAQAEFAELLQPQHSKDLLHPRYMTDEESCLETDQESYIRTDDEDGGNTEWEENRRRWVNR